MRKYVVYVTVKSKLKALIMHHMKTIIVPRYNFSSYTRRMCSWLCESEIY